MLKSPYFTTHHHHLISILLKVKYLTQKLLVRILILIRQNVQKNYPLNNSQSKGGFSFENQKFLSPQDTPKVVKKSQEFESIVFKYN